MKARVSALLCLPGIPAAGAFAHRGGPARPQLSIRASGPIPRQMANEGFDWHADYDPSKYERRQPEEYGGGGGGGRRRGGGGRGGGGGGGRPKKPKDYLGPNGHDYALSEDAGPNTSRLSEAAIHALLAERLQAKFARDFRTADAIQMELIDGGVFVHDGSKEWRADGVPYGSFGGEGPRARKADDQPYAKSPHSADAEGASDALIGKLILERAKFKMMREYSKADAVREGLRAKFNVLIDDRLKQWSVGGDFGEEHNALRELSDKFSNRGYIKSTSSLSLDEEEEEYIQHHVDARAAAKKDRKFEAADKIRLDLAQRFDVTINDKQKLWSVGGVFEEMGGKAGKPKGVYTRRGGGDLSSEDVDAIVRMISDRHHAKKQRNYAAADEVRDALMREYNVKVDDRSGEWRVDTNDYAMAGESNGLSEDEVAFVESQLKERFALKNERMYEDADAIRDDLRDRFGVRIDDRTKEWFVENEELESLVG